MQFDTQNEQPQRRLLFSQQPLWPWLILGLLFVIALVIRIFGINGPLLDFHPVKQYRSALIARAYYYESLDSLPEWKRNIARINKERLGTLHPPIMDRAAAFAYLITGAEHLWIPRLLSSTWWLVGGLFLYLIAQKIELMDTAILSTAFYLLLPFGVIASQSFQIDPLMIMMMTISLFSTICYHEVSSKWRLLIAIIFSATAILIKPVCLFIIFGGFTALVFHKQGLRGTFLNPVFWLFIGISLFPAALFYGYSILTGGVHQTQAEVSFVPGLVFQFWFWDGWLKRIKIVMGFTYFLGGLLGVLIFRQGWPKTFLLGLWIGYFVMCFVFTYTISTHDYYHLPLVPIVALSLGSITSSVLERLGQEVTTSYWRLTVWGVLFLMIFLSAGTSVQARRSLPNFENYIQVAQTIGDKVLHSSRTLILETYYGRPLMYHGEFSGDFWPHRYDIRDEKLWGEPEMSAEMRFETLNLKGSYEFFVITDFQDYETQEELKSFLTKNFPVLAKNEDYLIFDLREKVDLVLE